MVSATYTQEDWRPFGWEADFARFDVRLERDAAGVWRRHGEEVASPEETRPLMVIGRRGGLSPLIQGDVPSSRRAVDLPLGRSARSN